MSEADVVPQSGIVVGEDGVARCSWADSTPEYRAYHDTEWGFPVADDLRLFEKLCLEGFQAGLSWLTILRKREAFRSVFVGFDFEQIAGFGGTRSGGCSPMPASCGTAEDRGGDQQRQASGRARRIRGHNRELRVAVRAAPRTGPRTRSAGGTGPHGRVDGAREGTQAARVAVRRTDDRLRVHAGDGARERSSRRLPCARRRRGRARAEFKRP